MAPSRAVLGSVSALEPPPALDISLAREPGLDLALGRGRQTGLNGRRRGRRPRGDLVDGAELAALPALLVPDPVAAVCLGPGDFGGGFVVDQAPAVGEEGEGFALAPGALCVAELEALFRTCETVFVAEGAAAPLDLDAAHCARGEARGRRRGWGCGYGGGGTG